MPGKTAPRRSARRAPGDAGRATAPADRAGPTPARPAATPSPPSRPVEESPLITTVRIPGYLAENIRHWLFENPGHTQHSMIFAGLAKLGIAVRDEDLEPRRRPRSSRSRR